MPWDFCSAFFVWETLFNVFSQIVCAYSQGRQLVSGEIMLFYISHIASSASLTR